MLDLNAKPANTSRTRNATLVATILASLVCVAFVTRRAPPSASMSHVQPLTLYYWSHRGRAGHIFGMLDEAGYPYTHIFEFGNVSRVASAFGASDGDGTFAPPIVHDGEYVLSQSTAIAAYLGEKLGFADGVPDRFKAIQHMNDLLDFFNEVFQAAKTADALRTFNDGGRFGRWMGNIEASIIGPHFYGDQVTYLDFYLLMSVDWAQATGYDAIIPKVGDQFAPYPKVNAAVGAMRRLESYRRNTLPRAMSRYMPSTDLIDKY